MRDAQSIAVALRERGYDVPVEVIAEVLTEPVKVSFVQAALAAAEADWRAHTGEYDASPTGRYIAIVKDGTQGDFGIPPTYGYLDAEGNPRDWCGFAVGAWLNRAGLHDDHRKSLYHVENVEAFFTYGARKNTNPKRLMVEYKGLDGATWEALVKIHTRLGQLRTWTDALAIRATPLAQLRFKPGQVVLINHYGAVDKAHHITMVRSWDGRFLERIEGNASYRIGGAGPNGEKWSDAVVVVRMDLADPAQLKRIYGVGTLSLHDFVPGGDFRIAQR